MRRAVNALALLGAAVIVWTAITYVTTRLRQAQYEESFRSRERLFGGLW